MSERRGDGLAMAVALGLVLAACAGPATMAERSKESFGFRIFLWVLIRSFWFGAGVLTYYLCTR